ncbi:MAG: ATP-binding protein [Thiohalomonadales bacterium]
MNIEMADITLHINEETSADKRELLRDEFIKQNGVMSANSYSERPHLFVVTYDPGKIQSHSFLDIVKKQGLHAQLIGL